MEKLETKKQKFNTTASTSNFARNKDTRCFEEQFTEPTPIESNFPIDTTQYASSDLVGPNECFSEETKYSVTHNALHEEKTDSAMPSKSSNIKTFFKILTKPMAPLIHSDAKRKYVKKILFCLLSCIYL